MRLSTVTALLLACALAGPAASDAAPRWFHATQISGDSGAQPDVEFTSRGEAIAAWGGKFDDWEGPAQAGFRPPGGVFGPPQDLEPGGHPELATRPNGAAAVVMFGGPPDYGLKTATRLRNGRFGATVSVPTHGLVGGFDVGVDDDGTTLIVWSQVTYTGEPARLWALRRSPGGSFDEAQVVSEHGWIDAPSVIVGPDGEATVIWDAFEGGQRADSSVVRVATAPRGGRFGEARALDAPAYDPGSQPSLLLRGNARGDTLAVWQRGELHYAGDGTPVPSLATGVYTAVRPAGGDWGPAERIPRPAAGGDTVLEMTAAVAPDGEAVVAYSDGLSVFFSTRPPDGAWRQAESLTSYPVPVCCSGPPPGDQRDPGVAFDAAGNLFLLFAGQPERNFKRGVWATVRAAGDDQFGTLDLVRAGNHVETPDVAVDPDGNAAAVWSEKERPGKRDFGAERVYAAIYDLAPPVVEQYVPAGQYLEASDGRFRFKLSEPARVTIEVSERGRPVGTVTGRGLRGPGSARVPVRLARRLSRPGAYRAKVVARDAAGRRSKARAARFRSLAR